MDVSYVRRVPLWPTARRDSHRIGRWQATGVPAFDVHEIAAGKLSALFTRGYPRDLFDAGLIPDIPGLDPAKLRTAFVVYGGGARGDWRDVCHGAPEIEPRDLARQLRSALTATEAQRTRPVAADAYLAELQAKAAPAQRMVVPLNPTELEFLDRVLDHGDIAPGLLTADPALQQRIATEPWLRWKAINVADHNALAASQRGVPEQPTTEAAYPYLTVQPDPAAEWGWTLMVRHPDGEPVAQSARYPSESEALAACDFAAGLVSARLPLRFAEWEPGWEYGRRRAGGDAITVRLMPVPAGWKLQAYRPDGDLEVGVPPVPDVSGSRHGAGLPPLRRPGAAPTGPHRQGLRMPAAGAALPPLRRVGGPGGQPGVGQCATRPPINARLGDGHPRRRRLAARALGTVPDGRRGHSTPATSLCASSTVHTRSCSTGGSPGGEPKAWATYPQQTTKPLPQSGSSHPHHPRLGGWKPADAPGRLSARRVPTRATKQLTPRLTTGQRWLL